jgi:type III secretion system-like peptide-binding chaperone
MSREAVDAAVHVVVALSIKWLWGVVFRWVGVFLLVAMSAGQAAADSFRDLLINYRCEVVNRLEQIYRTGDPSSDRRRFLSISVPGHPQGYVQCIFHDNQTALYCEAASGYWFDKKGEPRTFHQPAATVAALARMGFDTDDTQGNFKIDLPLAETPDFNAAADFMLRALHDGYGARADMRLRFNAPFAPKTPSTCIPVS